MGSGWHEWPLMIFTVFGQCVNANSRPTGDTTGYLANPKEV
ncbi:DmsC/YnfH family molybdoenzyme membrane anchor subunit [Salmonella enterica]|nr:DmsC/YnfH family molybdoenzyme membrane anchor subunit [Salmonella enterica]